LPANDPDLVLFVLHVSSDFLGYTVLDVERATGQARDVPPIARCLGLAVVLLMTSCKKEGSPEAVADAFVDAYFRQMNQEKAKEYTALGASAMLDAELKEVAQIRKEGYTPAEAAADIRVRRGDPVQRDHRIRFPYEIVIRLEGAEMTKQADVELTQIQGVWKVVRVGLEQR
jgi:hypothetical protein